ncbi:hypothetical protein FCL47_08840 [Desulfopila sp. IMCC35006]|uniref:hypothetical protein n=1 Tax=Desulfopila sp. IMCC35006 TaxID=2569542 RepID=UPI0010ABF7B7|nr:hypothetical protein [Desulfopila sp. IMCC35006]TKB26510.1 hypothetical protein FCL47_08840 [Desulfopila sp. IMCC35006]
MDIHKKIYQDLTPKQRAIACYSAVNREDQDEINRLIGHVPQGKNNGQALSAICQALHAYNYLTAEAMHTYLLVSCRLQSALSFCSAWLAAGGAPESAEYRKKETLVEKLLPLSEKLAGEVDAIRQAAVEWCKINKIPIDIFMGSLCLFPMPKDIIEQNDSKTLEAKRLVFSEITFD